MTFNSSFRLTGIDVALPAGTYVIETDEEEIGGVGFVAYHRIATSIQVSARGTTQVFQIDPIELEDMLLRDGEQKP